MRDDLAQRGRMGAASAAPIVLRIPVCSVLQCPHAYSRNASLGEALRFFSVLSCCSTVQLCYKSPF